MVPVEEGERVVEKPITSQSRSIARFIFYGEGGLIVVFKSNDREGDALDDDTDGEPFANPISDEKRGDSNGPDRC